VYATRTVSVPALAPESERRHVVVYLRDARPQGVMPLRVAISQHHETFTPRVVAVTVGSEVEFPNDDPIYHNVFSLSRAKNFNLGRYPRGNTRRVRFDRPGIVKVFCEIHSHMSATVMVFDHPWFAIPDEDGRFELPPVPAGDRQITAWHERLGDTTLHVRVESGRQAAADFVLPVPEQ
jgi:plastocyanin